MKLSRWMWLSGFALLCLAVLGFIFSGRILGALGQMLSENEPPQKADMIVVLGGDYYGSRILTAADLVHRGYAPKVLVSGSDQMYGYDECDLAIDFAVAHGYPREEFIPIRFPSLNTAEEAAADITELDRLGVQKYLLVTSIYHSARAARIFRREGPQLDMIPVSAPERYWPDGKWWKTRQGRKIWFIEFLKTIGDLFRI